MRLLRDLRAIMSPDVPTDVMRNMDEESMQGMCYATGAVSLVVAVCFVVFLVTRTRIDDSAVLTAISMAVCFLCCLVGHMAARLIIQRDSLEHRHVVAFSVCIFVVLSTWSMAVSFYRYATGTQMLTFFMVDMMSMCFIICRPWLAVALMGGSHGLLLVAMYVFDCTARVNMFNYLLLAILSMVGMIVRFHVELKASQRAVELEYVGRHDELTGLLNRKALDEDFDELVGSDLMVHLIDLNYFKEINDTYGHLTGDYVLRHAAQFLGELLPKARLYRFGGDEFLALEVFPEVTTVDDSYSFGISFEGMEFDVSLSIGSRRGDTSTKSELNALIIDADKEMYTIKKRTHSV